jgi:hypothetical protein
MAAPAIAVGAAASSSASGASAAAGAGSGFSAGQAARAGAAVGSRDDHGHLGWLAAGFVCAALLLVMLPAILVTAILPSTSGGSSGEAIGAGSPIPAGFIPVFNSASEAVDVNPYLLASVAYQESGFGTGAGWQTPNSAGCAGFMQICVGGQGGDTWDQTEALTAQPRATIRVKDAYTYGQRPSGYPLQTSAHPSYDDPFDATIAAAVVLRGKVGGVPIPNLDNTAYRAACGYYGACANSVANYAQTVISRARLWESESALASASTTTPIAVPPGSKLAQVVSVASQIGAMRIPYCWGGGHASTPGPSRGSYCHRVDNTFQVGDTEPGLDCSGAVRWLLASVGYHDPGPISSGQIGSWLAPGPGREVSVYYNAEHTFLIIAGRAWGTSDSNYRGGPGWTGPHATGGFAVAHPPGL